MIIQNWLNNFKENKALKKEMKQLEAINEKLRNQNAELQFNEKQISYVKHLILQDELINGLAHGVEGLYTELDTPFLDFITEVRVKLQYMERQNRSKRDEPTLRD